MKLQGVIGFINENALLTDGVSKKNILAGLDYISNLNLPKIYECIETYSRGTYSADYYISNSDEIKKNFYGDLEAIEFYKMYTDNWYSFPVLITKLKSGEVILIRGEEQAHWYCLDKIKLINAIHAKRIEDIDFFQDYDRDVLRYEDIDKISQLP